MTDILSQLSQRANGAGAQRTQLELEALYGLTDREITVAEVRWFGKGQTSSVDIELSNGETMKFPSILDMVRPQRVGAELVACTGARPKLTQDQAIHAVSLARDLASFTAVPDDDSHSVAWGVDVLQAAETLEFTFSNQGNRWAAFEQLARRDPWSHARGMDRPYEAGILLLRDDATGDRFLRSGWFLHYVRTQSSRETPVSVSARMARVGWERRGSEGKIKATAPGRSDVLIWTFYIVPAGWEDRDGR
jgi:hypothetical protein